jgi:hypothetical protein
MEEKMRAVLIALPEFLLAPLFVLAVALWLFGGAGTGRYQYVRRAEAAQDAILDTRTGRVYFLNFRSEDPASIAVDPMTGETEQHWRWTKGAK